MGIRVWILYTSTFYKPRLLYWIKNLKCPFSEDIWHGIEVSFLKFWEYVWYSLWIYFYIFPMFPLGSNSKGYCNKLFLRECVWSIVVVLETINFARFAQFWKWFHYKNKPSTYKSWHLSKQFHVFFLSFNCWYSAIFFHIFKHHVSF